MSEMDTVYRQTGKTIAFAASVILLKPLMVGFSYFSGWLISLICGDMLAGGLNLLFNTSRFASEHIPVICAVFGMFGVYFRTSTTVSKE